MLLFATGNNGKFEQVSRVLKEYGIELEQKAVDLNEPETDNLKEVALSKIKEGEIRCVKRTTIDSIIE